MAILRDCELWFPKLDPKRPNAKFNKENPTWEVQIRTTSKERKMEWELLNLPVVAVIPDNGAPYFRVNLRKKSIKTDKTLASPVTVVNGSLDNIDPNSIGNGSVANIRIFQYSYSKHTGEQGLTSVLMSIQVTKHVVFKYKARDDDFTMSETETIEPDDMGDDDETSQQAPTPTPGAPKIVKTADNHPDANF